MSVNIRDFPDAGILYAIEDNTGPDGYASVQDIGLALGQRDLRGLAVRLAWMRRYSMVEKHKHEPGRWRASRKGARAVKVAAPALDRIEEARGPEFDLLRRTVEHYRFRHNGNGRKKR
jgi:hypothetical protein